ncbi:FtsK/SpoIIIE family DNA translocase [Flavisolibacter nicotianae]|uniref:FtsK/SpoIIIE family DNA translocase n=1 Tax=Flavisolibacter nicotianae TaxID=2364882 RepID=UPI000EB06336|nr:DNA translocase FtsK [Flavisolibacter nicotianae]
MANELKSKTPKVAEKPEKKEKADKAEKVVKPKKATSPAKKATGSAFRKEKEEKIDLKKLAKDERTQKIMGTVSLLVSAFLFISFISYFFTWKEDQSQIFNKGIGFLFDNDTRVSNLLGRLGAYVSHGLIRQGFGLASFLFCCFFFVVGINKLSARNVYSIWKNLRYVTIGLVILSVTLSFLFSSLDFPFGGSVGDMINAWLKSFLGSVGTACLLLAVGVSYSIWQFNPTFEVPIRNNSNEPEIEELTENEDAVNEEAETEILSPIQLAKQTATINDLYAAREEAAEKPVAPNALNGSGEMVLNINPAKDEKDYGFSVVERDEPEEDEEEEIEEPEEDVLPVEEPAVEPLVDDIRHEEEEKITKELPIEGPKLFIEEPKPSKPGKLAPENIQLEIKTAEEPPVEEGEERQKDYSDLPPYEPTLDLRDYKYPTVDLLEQHGSERIVQDPAELEANKNQIINTLKNYDITIQKISATVGPTVTLYEIVPAAGVRISRIKNLEDDIALSLAALGIRIIAPIPGKGTIGIEVPNVKKTIVSMKTLLSSEKFIHNTHSLPIAIGKRIDNENFIVDLASMPHLLMAGATGQGKSVGLNAVLVSLLYKKHPSQLKFVLIDPKKVELSVYRHIENHFLAKLPGEEDAIITDTKKVINTLNALCIEMDNRYDLLKEAGSRNIKEYNEKFTRRRLNPQKGHQYLPFIVLVVDEFADLIMTAGKEVEMPIARLAQLARAVGIHLIIATQRPSVNIITGTIKANFPARIAFKVSSKIDSRTILDAGGAEQLIGKGDMLISYNGEITRLQCAFVDTPEVEKIVDYIADQRGYPQAFMLPEYVDEKELEGKDFDASDKDPLFEDAAKLIVQNQIGSTSLLQRRMKLGYNRAGRLMDQLEAAGVVGPNLGSKAREVLIKTDAELMEFFETLN